MIYLKLHICRAAQKGLFDGFMHLFLFTVLEMIENGGHASLAERIVHRQIEKELVMCKTILGCGRDIPETAHPIFAIGNRRNWTGKPVLPSRSSIQVVGQLVRGFHVIFWCCPRASQVVVIVADATEVCHFFWFS